MTTLINASTTAGLIQTADTTGNLSLQSNGTTILALTSAGAAVTGTLSATGLTLDSSGNLGIGVTPAAGVAGYKGVQIGNAALYGRTGNTTNSEVYLAANSTVDDKYIGNDFAAILNSNDGAWVFKTAASGTAGNAISWTTVLTMQSNGLPLIPAVYSFTSGSAANVFVQSDGSMVRSTSSLKYKENLRYADDGALDSVKSAMLQLRGFRYQSVDKQFDGDRDFIGWGAEHLDALGLKELVQYDKDGSPTGVMYDRAVVPLTMIVKELSAKIEALEARLAALETK